MIKLLIVSQYFWPEGGGGTLAVYLITKLLASVPDFKVTVLTGTENPAKIKNVNFIIEPSLRSSNKISFYLKSHVFTSRLKKVIQCHDIVYIQYGYPLIILARKLRKKVIVHLHDFQIISYNATIPCLYSYSNLLHKLSYEIRYELSEHRSIIRAFTGSILLTFFDYLHRAWISMADKIICVSRRQAEIISRRVPNVSKNIEVVYNPPPECPEIVKELSRPALLYVGGSSYVKGFQVLLEASVQLLRRGSSLVFYLAGNYDEKSKRILSALNKVFNGRYLILGKVAHKHIIKVHRYVYALLFTSIIEEPLPYAVLESMVMGTIPVASRVGGVPEIVEGTPAERYLFKPGDSEELAEKIENVTNMPKEEIIEIGVKLREATNKKFDRELIRQQIVRVIEKVLSS